MSRTTGESFMDPPIDEGVGWIVKCGAVAGGIFAGAKAGYLQEACMAAIGGFTVVRGLIPYASIRLKLRSDRKACTGEVAMLDRLEIQHADVLIDAAEQPDAGSVVKLLAAMQSIGNGGSKADAAREFLNAAGVAWSEELDPLNDACEQVTLLGVGGSLAGLLGALNQLSVAIAGGIAADGNAWPVVFQSLATMASTSIVSCGCAVTLIGLRSFAERAVERHLSELAIIAADFAGTDVKEILPPDRGDDTYQLLRKKKK